LKIGEDAFTVSAISRKCTGDIPMLTQRKQSLLRHGIDRVRRGKRIDIERTSDGLGSLVPVLANSRRCGRAPKFASRCQRSDSSMSRYALYTCCPIATPNLSREPCPW
jgi:hypothetical protein